MSAILIVDDNAYFRDYLCEAVRRLGGTPIMAASAREGLQVLASQSVDAVISDLLMPEMDGLELAREIRTMYPDMPLLMLSDGPEGITAPCLRAAQLIYGAAISEKSRGGLSATLAEFLDVPGVLPGKEAREPAA
ncbi:MAG: response regulator [Azospirillaceae bacterium]|nr:response regulator [Azospirillaceae bacterium]